MSKLWAWRGMRGTAASNATLNRWRTCVTASGTGSPNDYELRAAGDPLSLAGAARQVARAADARIPVHHLTTQQQLIHSGTSQGHTLATLCACFAVRAVLIAFGHLWHDGLQRGAAMKSVSAWRWGRRRGGVVDGPARSAGAVRSSPRDWHSGSVGRIRSPMLPWVCALNGCGERLGPSGCRAIRDPQIVAGGLYSRFGAMRLLWPNPFNFAGLCDINYGARK